MTTQTDDYRVRRIEIGPLYADLATYAGEWELRIAVHTRDWGRFAALAVSGPTIRFQVWRNAI